MEHIYTYTIFLVLLGVLAVPYWIRSAKLRRDSEEKFKKISQGGGLRP